MKSQTYLRLALLLPYLLWAILLPLTQVWGGNENPSLPDETILRLLALLPYLYVMGVIFWFIPYTLLALSLLLWSIKRQAKTILVVFASSPLMLTVLMLVEINLLSIATQDVTYSFGDSSVRDLMALNQVVIFASLIVGYLCVAIGFIVYKIFQALNILKETQAYVEPGMKEAV